jgi:hypothetical protein
MKKILFFVLLVISGVIGYSQSYYKATLTELYTYDKSSEEWILYQKNTDANITVVVEDEFVSFQAKTPSMYRIYLENKEPINTKSLRGYRYLGKNLKTDKMVKIDVLISNDSPVALISVINASDGFNLRFFLSKIIE